MAKYECKVCGYIYNEQHAGRTFDELTECPICNEGKENFIALDADNNPIEAVKEEVKEAEDFVEEVKVEDNFFEEAKEDAKDEETAADFYGEVKEEAVKQTFWAPIGRAQIVIVGQTAPKITVEINGKKEDFTISKGFFQKETKIDISRYIEDGLNMVTFHPSVCPLNMYIEIIEPYSKDKVPEEFKENDNN